MKIQIASTFLILLFLDLKVQCQANIDFNTRLSAIVSTAQSGDTNRVKYEIDPLVMDYFQFVDSIDQVKFKNSGYRIQLISFSGPGAKESATKCQTDFLKLHNETASYTKWDYPNWVVRIGDFRTKLEALEFHLRIREFFPASYIVADEIMVKY